MAYLIIHLPTIPHPTSHRTLSLPPVPRLLKADSPLLPHRLREKASVEASIITTRIASILPPHPAARAPIVLLLNPSLMELEQFTWDHRPSWCSAEGIVLAATARKHTTRWCSGVLMDFYWRLGLVSPTRTSSWILDRVVAYSQELAGGSIDCPQTKQHDGRWASNFLNCIFFFWRYVRLPRTSKPSCSY